MTLPLFPQQGPDLSDGRDELDRYYTPPRLAEDLVGLLPIRPEDEAAEPSAGSGAFARPLAKRCARVTCFDLDPLAPARAGWPGAWVQGDYLDFAVAVDWTVGNPPYVHALSHVQHALEQSRHVAFLLRLAFLEAACRVEWWATQGQCLRKVWVLAERPSFTGNSKSDSCPYGFFWWDREHSGPATIIPGWSWRGGTDA